jgi:hypothetical protein
MVYVGGGKPRGYFQGFKRKDGSWVEPLILFDNPHGSLLSLPVSKMSAEAVRRHIQESMRVKRDGYLRRNTPRSV